MSPLDTLAGLLEAATPRPWEVVPCTHRGPLGDEPWTAPLIVTVDIDAETSETVASCEFNRQPENAALIVAAVNALPGLLAVAKAASEYLDEVLELNDGWVDEADATTRELRAALTSLLAGTKETNG